MNAIDAAFVASVESAHFRTTSYTGANVNVLFVWNLVRAHVGLPRLSKDDLPAYCETHFAYHVIRKEYGCKKPVTIDD